MSPSGAAAALASHGFRQTLTVADAPKTMEKIGAKGIVIDAMLLAYQFVAPLRPLLEIVPGKCSLSLMRAIFAFALRERQELFGTNHNNRQLVLVLDNPNTHPAKLPTTLKRRVQPPKPLDAREIATLSKNDGAKAKKILAQRFKNFNYDFKVLMCNAMRKVVQDYADPNVSFVVAQGEADTEVVALAAARHLVIDTSDVGDVFKFGISNVSTLYVVSGNLSRKGLMNLYTLDPRLDPKVFGAHGGLGYIAQNLYLSTDHNDGVYGIGQKKARNLVAAFAQAYWYDPNAFLFEVVSDVVERQTLQYTDIAVATPVIRRTHDAVMYALVAKTSEGPLNRHPEITSVSKKVFGGFSSRFTKYVDEPCPLPPLIAMGCVDRSWMAMDENIVIIYAFVACDQFILKDLQELRVNVGNDHWFTTRHDTLLREWDRREAGKLLVDAFKEKLMYGQLGMDSTPAAVKEAQRMAAHPPWDPSASLLWDFCLGGAGDDFTVEIVEAVLIEPKIGLAMLTYDVLDKDGDILEVRLPDEFSFQNALKEHCKEELVQENKAKRSVTSHGNTQSLSGTVMSKTAVVHVFKHRHHIEEWLRLHPTQRSKKAKRRALEADGAITRAYKATLEREIKDYVMIFDHVVDIAHCLRSISGEDVYDSIFSNTTMCWNFFSYLLTDSPAATTSFLTEPLQKVAEKLQDDFGIVRGSMARANPLFPTPNKRLLVVSSRIRMDAIMEVAEKYQEAKLSLKSQGKSNIIPMMKRRVKLGMVMKRQDVVACHVLRPDGQNLGDFMAQSHPKRWRQVTQITIKHYNTVGSFYVNQILPLQRIKDKAGNKIMTLAHDFNLRLENDKILLDMVVGHIPKAPVTSDVMSYTFVDPNVTPVIASATMTLHRPDARHQYNYATFSGSLVQLGTNLEEKPIRGKQNNLEKAKKKIDEFAATTLAPIAQQLPLARDLVMVASQYNDASDTLQQHARDALVNWKRQLGLRGEISTLHEAVEFAQKELDNVLISNGGGLGVAARQHHELDTLVGDLRKAAAILKQKLKQPPPEQQPATTTSTTADVVMSSSSSSSSPPTASPSQTDMLLHRRLNSHARQIASHATSVRHEFQNRCLAIPKLAARVMSNEAQGGVLYYPKPNLKQWQKGMPSGLGREKLKNLHLGRIPNALDARSPASGVELYFGKEYGTTQGCVRCWNNSYTTRESCVSVCHHCSLRGHRDILSAWKNMMSKLRVDMFVTQNGNLNHVWRSYEGQIASENLGDYVKSWPEEVPSLQNINKDKRKNLHLTGLWNFATPPIQTASGDATRREPLRRKPINPMPQEPLPVAVATRKSGRDRKPTDKILENVTSNEKRKRKRKHHDY